MAPRPWPVPKGNTIHVVGDVHIGRQDGGYATGQNHADIVKKDLTGSRMIPVVAARIQVGDLTEFSTTAEVSAANAWTSSITGPRWYGVPGNHDLQGNARTPTEVMGIFTGWTPNTANWTADLGFVKLIGCGDVTMSPDNVNLALTANTYGTFLDTELGNTTKPCVILAHAPLESSVLGNTAVEYTSVDSENPQFSLDPTPLIKSVLNSHTNAKVILSGHTHSSLDGSVPSVARLYNLGTRNIIAVNASAVVYHTRTAQPFTNDIKTMFLTFTGSTVEIRVRDHGARCWSGIGNTKVTSFTVPA